jgi:26 proteasome complex subunit DSS1
MSPAAAQQQQQQQRATTATKQKKELVDLECDDEFEEFNEEEWTRENEEKEDVAQWEDDWDDTEADDFKTHLREELKKNIRK